MIYKTTSSEKIGVENKHIQNKDTEGEFRGQKQNKCFCIQITKNTFENSYYEKKCISYENSKFTAIQIQIQKTSNTQAHKRKVFDEMSAHKQYDSLKRKQKHYEQTRWEIARIV